MEFVAVLGCKTEDLLVPFTTDLYFSKRYIGLITISMDFVCILVAIQFYGKLRHLNTEYLDIIDSNDIKMSNFTVRINNF